MNNICRIKFGGEQRTFKFNLNSDAIICEGMGITLDEFNTAMVSSRQGRFFIWVFYAGLHNFYEAQNDMESIDNISYHKVADWLTESKEEDINKVFKTFISTHELKNKSNNGQFREGESKKKSTLKT